MRCGVTRGPLASSAAASSASTAGKVGAAAEVTATVIVDTTTAVVSVATSVAAFATTAVADTTVCLSGHLMPANGIPGTSRGPGTWYPEIENAPEANQLVILDGGGVNSEGYQQDKNRFIFENRPAFVMQTQNIFGKFTDLDKIDKIRGALAEVDVARLVILTISLVGTNVLR